MIATFSQLQRRFNALRLRRDTIRRWAGSPDICVQSWVPLWAVWLLIKSRVLGPSRMIAPVPPEQIQSSAETGAYIVLSAAESDHLEELIANPPQSNEKLRKLFRREDFPW